MFVYFYKHGFILCFFFAFIIYLIFLKIFVVFPPLVKDLCLVFFDVKKLGDFLVIQRQNPPS